MIVKMKKVTLLCLEQDKNTVLDKLRALGVMQLSYAKKPESADVDSLNRQCANAEKAYQILAAIDAKEKTPGTVSVSEGGKQAAEVLELVEQRVKLEQHIQELKKELDQLAPWGEFDPDSLDAIRAGGLYPYLCVARTDAFNPPGNVAVEIIAKDKQDIHYLLVSGEELDPVQIGAVSKPRAPLSVIQAELDAGMREQQAVEEKMLELKNGMANVEAYREELVSGLEFACARDGMAEAGALAYIFGYVPVTEAEKLQETARSGGMALLLEDPADDDAAVPTYIVKPKFLNIMDPLFDFIGVTPGYRENDVNVFFLLFFPIFFGMIIGDAGYGLLFLAVAFICKFIYRNGEKTRLALNLFILLSACALIWGWMSGSWCGIPRNILPGFMQGFDFIGDPMNSPAAFKFAEWVGLINDQMTQAARDAAMGDFKNKFIQFICFAIAGIHLPLARLFKFVDDIRSSWRSFGHLGWALLLFANAFLAIDLVVYPGFFPEWGWYLYGTGTALVIITISGGDVLNLPFSLIGSFVDVLSYIRLFAVGLAGAYISEKFNTMGGMLMDSFPDTMKVVGAICLIIVAVFGNLLNIALGFLSVLVHAIRLNTLEFSNHVGMQWAGTKFRPFKKHTDTTQS